MNGSKPNGPSSNRRTPRQRVSCGAAPRFLSPHPGPLPGGEGEAFPARRTIQRGRFSTAGSSLFPLPTGEGQGEGKRREFHPAYWINHGTVEQRDLRQSWRVPQMTLTLSLIKGIQGNENLHIASIGCSVRYPVEPFVSPRFGLGARMPRAQLRRCADSWHRAGRLVSGGG